MPPPLATQPIARYQQAAAPKASNSAGSVLGLVMTLDLCPAAAQFAEVGRFACNRQADAQLSTSRLCAELQSAWGAFDGDGHGAHGGFLVCVVNHDTSMNALFGPPRSQAFSGWCHLFGVAKPLPSADHAIRYARSPSALSRRWRVEFFLKAPGEGAAHRAPASAGGARRSADGRALGAFEHPDDLGPLAVLAGAGMALAGYDGLASTAGASAAATIRREFGFELGVGCSRQGAECPGAS